MAEGNLLGQPYWLADAEESHDRWELGMAEVEPSEEDAKFEPAFRLASGLDAKRVGGQWRPVDADPLKAREILIVHATSKDPD